MSHTKTIKRLVGCFGTIQLTTALSVLKAREKEQQALNYKYEDYLLITPLFAPQGQNEEFAAFITKMAESICSWENIAYLSLEQTKSIAEEIKKYGLAKISPLVHNFVGVDQIDEIYLSRTWNLENTILLNVYDSATKICYGDGIGIYFSHSAFHGQKPLNTNNNFKSISDLLKQQIKDLLPRKRQTVFQKQEFDLGYFSLPYAFGEIPPMETVVLDRKIYLKTFQTLRKSLDNLVDFNYIKTLQSKICNASVSILLTSNFSEASRMPLEKEITAYREFLASQKIAQNSILLIKPHPRDSKQKIAQLQSALSDLYLEVIPLIEDFLFYLPFEVLFMELFLRSDLTKLQNPKIFTFSSASLTLEFLFDADCIIGFGHEIVNKYFYAEHIDTRLKHESDLLTTTKEVRELITA